MAPIGATNTVELKFRDAFSHDPAFADCWSTLERQRDQFRRDCSEVQDKILGNPQLKAIALLAPSSLPGYVKASELGQRTSRETTPVENGNGHEYGYGFNANGNNTYKIIIDAHQFNPDAHGISVKTSNQERNVILIEGMHNERVEGHGTIARYFARKCVLPFEVKVDQVEAILSSDGVLLINVPLKISGAKPKRELMTVDGRKLEEDEVDLTRLDSKKAIMLNWDGIVNREQLKNWDPKIQTLPDFEMVPFWSRNYSPHYQERGGLGIQNDSENFSVLVDVKAFLPEEINVRCTDQFLVVEGNQEMKQDPFGSLSRQFARRYELPEGVKPDVMSCNLSDGVLHVKAPKPKPRMVDDFGFGVQIPVSMSEPDHGLLHYRAASPAPSSQRVYVPPRRAVAAQTNGWSAANCNGHEYTNGYGDRESPVRMQVNGDAHSNRTIIPFASAY